MPIKNLTDQYRANGPTAVLQKHQARIGFLQKGELYTTNDGKTAPRDLEFFRFRPTVNNAPAAAAAFVNAYGREPKVIEDIRIPVDLAGNFNIESTAWLTCHKYSKKAGKDQGRDQLFLGRSDGEYVYQLRDGATGKMITYQEGEYPRFEDVAKPLPDKPDVMAYLYQGHLYEWRPVMMIDLILPDLNRELLDLGCPEVGSVTFITRSKNDIPNLIAQYGAILDELTGLLTNPTDTTAYERQRRYIPLRDMPLTLSRYKAAVSTPGYKDDAPGTRRPGERWLVRLSVNAEFARAMERARADRTAYLLQYIGSGGQISALTASAPIPLLGAKTSGPWDDMTDEAANAALFGSEASSPRPVRPTAAAPLADPTEAEEVMEGYFTEEGDLDDEDLPPWAQQAPDPGDPPAIIDHKAEALNKRTKAEFCTLLHDWDKAGAWADETAVSLAYDFICGRFNLSTRDLAWEALASYANKVADGGGKKTSAEAAKTWYETARKARAGQTKTTDN